MKLTDADSTYIMGCGNADLFIFQKSFDHWLRGFRSVTNSLIRVYFERYFMSIGLDTSLGMCKCCIHDTHSNNEKGEKFLHFF